MGKRVYESSVIILPIGRMNLVLKEMKKLYNLFDDDIASILSNPNPVDFYGGSNPLFRFSIFVILIA